MVKFWEDDLAREDSWWLETPYHGESQCLLEHIEAGVKLASEKPDSLLVFSGGETKEEAGPLSEGASYWFAADRMNWFGYPEIRNRAYAETYARDSFENLLFSVLRFFRQAGTMPSSVVVAGWTFKEERFRFHASTIHLGDRLQYCAVNNPPESKQHTLASIIKGEAAARKQFTVTPFGDSGELLRKRRCIGTHSIMEGSRTTIRNRQTKAGRKY